MKWMNLNLLNRRCIITYEKNMNQIPANMQKFCKNKDYFPLIFMRAQEKLNLTTTNNNTMRHKS